MESSISGVPSREFMYKRKNIIELDCQAADLMGMGSFDQVYLLGIREADSLIRELTLVIDLKHQRERLYYKIPIKNSIKSYLQLVDLNNNGKKDIGVWIPGQELGYYVYFNQGDSFRLGWTSEGLKNKAQAWIREYQTMSSKIDKSIKEELELWLDPINSIEIKDRNLVFRQPVYTNKVQQKLGELKTNISFNQNDSVTHYELMLE